MVQTPAEESGPSLVTRLYPAPAETRRLEGTYLAHWQDGPDISLEPYVYADFIVSLDGRISEVDPVTTRRRVPETLANPRDWRLYMELLAQADAVLTSDRHLRAVAAGRQRDLLSIAESEYPDLVAWREQHGLRRHPACVAIAPSLDVPIERLQAQHPAPIVIFTRADADPARIAAVRATGTDVVAVGESRYLDGATIVNVLARRGYRRIFVIAGPRVLHTLLADNRVARLYLTLVPSMLGGEEYDTLTKGPHLSPPRAFYLRELYLDMAARGPVSQLFFCFDSMRRCK